MESLKFKPYLKQTIWGGNRLSAFKQLVEDLPHVGESWEISSMEGCESIVANGPYEGQTLTEVIRKERDCLMGKAVYQRFGDRFPLLIKFIDAAQDLSIQVHPDETKCKMLEGAQPKNEMWYVLDAQPGAYLYSGFNQELTPDRFQAMIHEGNIVEALVKYDVREGDTFYTPAGKIHAIGAGCLIAEIQQASDTTYRVFDYNRRDAEGNKRELHLQEASMCLDYRKDLNGRTEYQRTKNKGANLVRCPWFDTLIYDLTEPFILDYTALDCFVLLIGVKGSGTITDDEGHVLSIHTGETILVPATTKTLRTTGEMKFIACYLGNASCGINQVL